jgi:hypothetical protein
LAEVIVGSGGEVLGVGLDATVIAAPLGVSVNVASASVIIHGGAVTLHAASLPIATGSGSATGAVFSTISGPSGGGGTVSGGTTLSGPTPGTSASQEINGLGQLQGKSKVDIEAQLTAQGYSSVPANNGGTIWTKAGADGNTAAVRIDPAMVRANPKGFADEVSHVHKEIVPSSAVSNGNYPPSAATTLDDFGNPTTDPRLTHIPGGH